MAVETEIERLLVRLVGDATSYQRMLKDAQASSKRAATAVELAGRRMERIQMSLQKAGRAMAAAGRRMTMFVTAPIVGMGALAIKAGADFESGFAGVRKTVDATEAEFATLRQGFKDMSTEIPVAVEELLGIGEIAGQLGIHKRNILSFTDTIAKLGATTNLVGEEGAQQIARFANIVGMSQGQFSNLASSLVALGNSADITSGALATTEADIMAMSMRLAGAGKQIGLTAPQITGLGATLSALGLQAEAGGTAFSKLFIDLQIAVAKGGEGLEAFATTARMTTGAFRELFRRDTLAAVTALLDGIKASGEKAGIALEKMGVEGSRQIAALLAASKNVPLLTEAIASSSKAFRENTALAKEAAERFKTFWAQVTLLKSEMKLLLGEVFEVTRPYLLDLVDRVKSLVGWFRNLSPEVKKTAVIIALVAAAVGPLLIGLGGLVSLAGLTISGFGAMIGILGALLSPTMLVVGAVTALGAAVIHWTGAGGQAVNWFGRQWDGLVQHVRPAIDGIKDALAAGDIPLANKILWAQIELEWVRGIGALKESWIGFVGWYKTSTIDIAHWLVSTQRKAVYAIAEFYLRLRRVFDKSFDVVGAVTALRDMSDMAQDIIAKSRQDMLGEVERDVDKQLRQVGARVTKLKDELSSLVLKANVDAQAHRIGSMLDRIIEQAKGKLAVAKLKLPKFDVPDIPDPPPINIRFNVEGIQAVEAGSAAALAHLAAFEAGKPMRPGLAAARPAPVAAGRAVVAGGMEVGKQMAKDIRDLLKLAKKHWKGGAIEIEPMELE